MTAKTIRFAKDGHHYVFRYGPDMQDEMIDQIMTLAENRDYNLDWLDAATLSFQIAQYTAAGDGDILMTSFDPYNS